jgi:hypothetical protein
MDYASPFVQLMELLTAVFISAVSITASVLFLRERSAGGWLMLVGSVFFAICLLPKAIYVSISFFGVESNTLLEGVMYFTIWNWLSFSASMVFSIGLLLTALRRRGLAKRIKELETLLDARENRSE